MSVGNYLRAWEGEMNEKSRIPMMMGCYKSRERRTYEDHESD